MTTDTQELTKTKAHNKNSKLNKKIDLIEMQDQEKIKAIKQQILDGNYLASNSNKTKLKNTAEKLLDLDSQLPE